MVEPGLEHRVTQQKWRHADQMRRAAQVAAKQAEQEPPELVGATAPGATAPGETSHR